MKSTKDYALEVARGLVPNVTSVNKFGAALDGIQTTKTDIWSQATWPSPAGRRRPCGLATISTGCPACWARRWKVGSASA